MNTRQQRVLKLVMWILALCLIVHVAGRPLYWHLSENFNATVRHAASSSCPPCPCDCSFQPLLSLPEAAIVIPPKLELSKLSDNTQLPKVPKCLDLFGNAHFGLSNSSITDCMKENPLISEDMEKSFIDLVSEEVKLKEAEARENHRRADVALLEAKKLASQYQKEADKCNSGMDTCEEAREKAEATLDDQMKITALWELRARQRGWAESRVRFRHAYV